MSLDPRFLTVHPATALWWEQRQQCERCRHVEIDVPQMRCRKINHPIGTGKGGAGRVIKMYCIDARLPGQPCGPDAALFKEKK